MRPIFWWLSIVTIAFVLFAIAANRNEAYWDSHPGVALDPCKPVAWVGNDARCDTCGAPVEVMAQDYCADYWPDGRFSLNLDCSLTYAQSYICRNCSKLWPIRETFYRRKWRYDNRTRRPNVGVIAGAAAAAR